MSYETTLARRFAFDLNLGTDAVPIWTRIIGVTEAKPTVDPTLQEDNDYDSDGWGDDTKTAQKWSVELKLSHKADTDTDEFHPTHEALELAAEAFEGDAKVQLRYFDRQGRSLGRKGWANVKWTAEGGDYAALDAITVELTGKGALEKIPNPVNETPVPIVASATPNTDVAAGGARVVIRGNGFATATTVKFGATTATGFTIIDDHVIVVNAPAHAAGSAPVKVTNANGESTTSAAFTYTA